MSVNKLYTGEMDSGFTLVEVLVAMLVGSIVMAMAVAILGSTNSTALRVIAKSEVQENTRASVAKLFDSLANANSLETCRVGRTPGQQSDIKVNGPGRSGVVGDNCKEAVGTGYIIALAQPNRLCYFKKIGDDSTGPVMSCISRGDGGNLKYPGPSAAGVPSSLNDNVVHKIDFGSCPNPPLTTAPNLVYVYDCSPNAGSINLNWPNNFSQIANSTRIFADLGSTNTQPPKENLFEYLLDGVDPSCGSVSYAVDYSCLEHIIGVNVNLEIAYDSKSPAAAGLSQYKFKQTIILRHSNKAMEETYNG